MIVVDGAVDLPPDLVGSPDVRTVPSSVFVESAPFDGPPEVFWRALRQGRAVSTGAPTVSALADAYAGGPAIAVHVSGELSLTVSRALEAAQRGAGGVAVVDSGSLSVGAGLVAVETLRLMQQCAGYDAASAAARHLPGRLHTFAMVNDPGSLVAGGRAGILPEHVSMRRPMVLAVRGRALVLDQPRDRAGALRSLARRAGDHARVPGARWALGHGDADDVARVADQLAASFGRPATFVALVDPTVGTHLGPDALVVATLR